jgi:hypothetical protein
MTFFTDLPETLAAADRAYVVAGMHRSGTSAMARCLGLAGYGALPTDFFPQTGQAFNPTGHWEARTVVTLNDLALEALGSAWDDLTVFRPLPFPAPAFVGEASAALTEAFPEPGPIVLKDPRISLMAQAWQAALSQRGCATTWIIMVRAPQEVAASLAARDGMPLLKGRLLWAGHMLGVEAATRGLPRVFVDYRRLLDNWRRELGRISAVAGSPPVGAAEAAEIDAFLDPQLHRQRARPGEDANPLSGALGALEALFAAAARDEPLDTGAIDQLHGQIRALEPSALSDSEGVRHAYRLFLGRDVESGDVLELKQRMPCVRLLQSFIDSEEFNGAVRDPIIEGRPTANDASGAPPPLLLRTWARDFIPLSEAGRAAIADASEWRELYRILFRDPVFQTMVVRLNRGLAGASFLAGLSSAAESGRGEGLSSPGADRPEADRNPVPTPDKGGQDTGSGDVRQPTLTWVLVTGAPRSGTTLMRRLIAEHPDAALLQEYGLGRFVERLDALLANGEVFHSKWQAPVVGGLADAQSFYRDREARHSIDPLDGKLLARDFNAVAQSLFSTLGRRGPPTVVGDKAPMVEPWEDVPRLMRRLGDLRIVIVVRNPRDAIHSSLIRRGFTQGGGDEWPIATVEDAIRQWLSSWRRTVALKSRYGSRVHVLKYEDLCIDPAGVLGEVQTFLGLSKRPPEGQIEKLPEHIHVFAPEESATLERLLGAVVARWPDASVDELLTEFSDIVVAYNLGKRMDLAQPETDVFIDIGFSRSEPWGRWTDGRRARISLFHGIRAGALLVELWLARAHVPQGERCDVIVRTGDGPPELMTLGPEPRRLSFLADAARTARPGLLDLDFSVVRPKVESNPRADRRALGFGLEAFRVSRIAD